MILNLISTFLAFVAFVFLLFATIGDIHNQAGITNIYYYRADFTSAGGWIGSITHLAGEPDFATMGLWSYCYGTYAAGVQYCSPPKLGYEIDSTGIISSILSQDASIIDSSMSQAIAGLFIPSIVLTFLAIFPGVFAHRSRVAMHAAVWLSLLAFIFTFITFIAALVIYGIVSNSVKDVTSSIQISFGCATWLTLGAVLALLLANAGFIFSCCCSGRRRNNRAVAAASSVPVAELPPADEESVEEK